MTQFSIVTVCTMNICRSPAAQEALTVRSAQWQLDSSASVVVTSAGTHAVDGSPACPHTLAALGLDLPGHASRPLTTEILNEADLVVTAAESHVSEAILLAPTVRQRIFSLPQAARYARWITNGPVLSTALAKARGETIVPDFKHPETMTDPLPADSLGRLHWLVRELDAARGVAPEAKPSPDRRWGANDIPDPHVLGSELHQFAAESIDESVATLGEAVELVLDSQP
ncbi:MAG: hypothetical protein WAS05_10050 [Candidatus Nanopelagicales bacterium]